MYVKGLCVCCPFRICRASIHHRKGTISLCTLYAHPIHLWTSMCPDITKNVQMLWCQIYTKSVCMCQPFSMFRASIYHKRTSIFLVSDVCKRLNLYAIHLGFSIGPEKVTLSFVSDVHKKLYVHAIQLGIWMRSYITKTNCNLLPFGCA